MQRVRRLRPLTFLLLAAAGLALSGCGASVAASRPAGSPAPHRTDPALPWRASRASRAVPGDILIADAQNSRILLVTPQKKIVWQFPVPGKAPNRPFRYPDDAFFTPGYGGVITNEEDFGTIAIISFAKRKVVWEYGTPGREGSGPGQLDYPDDAILRAHGIVTVADIRNQRILFIRVRTHQVVKQYGKTGVYFSNPPTTFAAPNGDFPAPHGGMLVSEINSTGHGNYNEVILLSRTGKVVWQVHIPGIQYISDANFTPQGNIIAVDYSDPGQIVIASPKGKVLWRWRYTAGPRKLNQPSLAVQLPNGNILANDDGNDRVIVINPRTRRIVWQYGHTGVPGSAPGYLNDPDGCDLLPNGVVPGRAPAIP